MNLGIRARWLPRPIALLIATSAIYIAVAIPLGSRANKWSEVIYFATGLILIWYTVETHAMRKETTRQAELAVRPLVLARLESPQGLVVRNIGSGPALYVKVEDIEFDTDAPTGRPSHVAKFATTDVIEAKAEVPATVQLARITGEGTIKPLYEFLSSLDPKYQKNLDLPIVIHYQDLYGTLHRTRLEMGKSGTRFIGFE